jgi:hypothetical protein
MSTSSYGARRVAGEGLSPIYFRVTGLDLASHTTVSELRRLSLSQIYAPQTTSSVYPVFSSSLAHSPPHTTYHTMNTSATSTQSTPQRFRTKTSNATSLRDRFGAEDVQGIAQDGRPQGLNDSTGYTNGTVDDVIFRMSGLPSNSPTSDRPANPSPASEFSGSSSEGSTTIVDDRLLLPSQVSKRLKRAVTDNTYFASRQVTGTAHVIHASPQAASVIST